MSLGGADVAADFGWFFRCWFVGVSVGQGPVLFVGHRVCSWRDEWQGHGGIVPVHGGLHTDHVVRIGLPHVSWRGHVLQVWMVELARGTKLAGTHAHIERAGWFSGSSGQFGLVMNDGGSFDLLWFPFRFLGRRILPVFDLLVRFFGPVWLVPLSIHPFPVVVVRLHGVVHLLYRCPSPRFHVVHVPVQVLFVLVSSSFGLPAPPSHLFRSTTSTAVRIHAACHPFRLQCGGVAALAHATARPRPRPPLHVPTPHHTPPPFPQLHPLFQADAPSRTRRTPPRTPGGERASVRITYPYAYPDGGGAGGPRVGCRVVDRTSN
mmetsp:Transcript_10218/g.62353  ORF Transcript_10218/g.62353 Transcript_10218/m.62353 type:complete len:320 (-) Transcript_10218:1185-2144(-)